MKLLPNKKHFKGFTLVELIIVITILAILGTIAYISFQGYTKDARDGVRISDIKQIYNGLSIYKVQTEKTLLPDNYINIQSGTTTISYQGYAGASVLRTLKISGGKDPGTKDYYIYTTDVNTKKAQLMTYMETSDKDVQLLSQLKDLSIINQAQAVTNTGYYQDKKIYVYGDKIGILTNNKVPLQETTTLTGIDITSLTGNITTYFGGNVYSSGVSTSTGITLVNQINSQITNSTICDPGYSLIGGVCTLVNYFTGAGTSGNPYRINGVGLSDTTTIATSCNYYNLNATTNTSGTLRGAGTCGNGSQECFSSGIYLIDTDGVGGNNAFNVYCDMSFDGGGWTDIIGKFYTTEWDSVLNCTGLTLNSTLKGFANLKFQYVYYSANAMPTGVRVSSSNSFSNIKNTFVSSSNWLGDCSENYTLSCQASQNYICKYNSNTILQNNWFKMSADGVWQPLTFFGNSYVGSTYWGSYHDISTSYFTTLKVK